MGQDYRLFEFKGRRSNSKVVPTLLQQLPMTSKSKSMDW